MGGSWYHKTFLICKLQLVSMTSAVIVAGVTLQISKLLFYEICFGLTLLVDAFSFSDLQLNFSGSL